MDKILEAFLTDNDELYVLHEPGTNAFTLKQEDGKQTKKFSWSKNHFGKSQNWREKCAIFWGKTQP